MTIDNTFDVQATTGGLANYLKLNANLNAFDADGNIRYDDDRAAAKDYFLNHINPNTYWAHNLEEKLDFLVDNDYYEKEFLELYSKGFVKKLFQTVYNYEFRFPTFVGAYKFYTSYALKTFDGRRFLERFEDRVTVTALYLAQGDEKLAKQIAEEIITGRLQPATPTFLNAGKKSRGDLVSCFLLNIEDDLNSIGRAWNSAAQLSKRGGGVALNLTNIRGKKDPIKNVEGAASGVIPVMKILEDTFSYANQLGARQGAGAVYLNAHHIDILDFLDTKRENADEKIRIKTLSLGVVIPDITFELAKKGEPMYLFSPYDMSKAYGKEFAFINVSDVYYEAVDNPNIRKKKIDPRAFLNTLAEIQMESGYPYIMFEDSVNRQSALDGKITMSNLCSEILQPQLPSIVNDDQTYSELGKDISCNLASFNVRKVLESPDFAKSVDTAIRLLTQVSDLSDIEAVPTVRNGNAKAHAVGLGAMNLHGAFAHHHMFYGDEESLDLTNMYFYLVTYHAINTSATLAKEKGSKFDGFEKSDYASGVYFDRYINPATPTLFTPQTDKVKAIFADIAIPTPEDWEKLAAKVKRHGMYNQNLQAVPPTGSISYINHSTSSIHPVTSNYVETRKEGKLGTVFVPTAEVEGNEEYFGAGYSMYTIDSRTVIDVYSIAQFYVDQGLSLTLGYLSSNTTKDIVKNVMYAYSKGKSSKKELDERGKVLAKFPQGEIKTIYYARILNEDIDGIADSNECVSCAL
jgi:ribonucleoside-diphosphate reductase alpha chain